MARSSRFGDVDGVLAIMVRHSRQPGLDSSPSRLEQYDIEAGALGQGSFGCVSKATNKATREQCAIKAVWRRKPWTGNRRPSEAGQKEYANQINREVEIMQRVDHPNIVRLIEQFDDHEFVYLVLELCCGGELLDQVFFTPVFTESKAAMVMEQVLSAVQYMHENDICHRDLKPANFLWLTREPIEHNTLKAIDFGLSVNMAPSEALRSQTGTPYYMSPQVSSGKSYNTSADLWSCGVILYVLLCGYPPFDGKSTAAVDACVRRGNYSFPEGDFETVSEEAKEIVRGLLQMDPRHRITAPAALDSPWIRQKAPNGVQLSPNFKPNLTKFLRRDQSEQHSDSTPKETPSQAGLAASLAGALGLKNQDNVVRWLDSWVSSPMWCTSNPGPEMNDVPGHEIRYD